MASNFFFLTDYSDSAEAGMQMLAVRFLQPECVIVLSGPQIELHSQAVTKQMGPIHLVF